MINLQINKTTAKSGATEFDISPSSISLGNYLANNVDKLKIKIPDEWEGLTIRMTVSPFGVIKNQNLVYFIEEPYEQDVTSDMTQFINGGVLVFDGYTEDDYHAFTCDCEFSVVKHSPVGSAFAITHTENEYDRYLNEVKGYRQEAHNVITLADNFTEAFNTISEFRDEAVGMHDEIEHRYQEFKERLASGEYMGETITNVFLNEDKCLIVETNKQNTFISERVTPERGVDYWTADDKEDIINEILELFPIAEEEFL